MKESNPVTIHRKDYQAPSWTIHQTKLEFDLSPAQTTVKSDLHLRRLSAGALELDGDEVELVSLHVDGQALSSDKYSVTDEHLIIRELPEECVLSVETRIAPEKNTALEGLYCSAGNMCTQCEAEGFRKITYYLDRPDVLSTFSVSIVADKTLYPVMLSNGNLVSQKDLDNNRHRVDWHDPFPKPCYLFALVAGKLARIEDHFITASKRRINLHIYVEEHNVDQCQFAMDALKRSMLWDEQIYGLEYDLDLFMIVAVDDFNAGAMENKGLNIFNSKYVLADENLATDQDFLGVEAVIAHEYFHNWTGNRVTCRDWFQLSLKEGLTVFRDQEFSADMQSRDVKRIEDVQLLRAHQFTEDAGPMSHPIRPDQYIEINNFYTLTVYEKGAEIVRMIHTLLGAKNYRAGIDLYFERHDGEAVTCDDFVSAMEDASGIDLTQFRRWYSQSGTPAVSVTDHYDAELQQYRLNVKQENPDREGKQREPLHIPLSLGLLDESGQAIPLKQGRIARDGSAVIDLIESEQTFTFDNIKQRPTPSLLRGFSAPVNLSYNYDDATLGFLLANDADSFNRWEAGQRLATRVIEKSMSEPEWAIDETFVDAFENILNDTHLDAGFKAIVLDIPDIKTLANNRNPIDIRSIGVARKKVKQALAKRHAAILIDLVENNLQQGIGDRSLSNAALALLSALPSKNWLHLATAQYDNAANMTDKVAALKTLCNLPGEETEQRLLDFYNTGEQHKLVIDKWFAMQASADHDKVLATVTALTSHPAFDYSNPNRLRSVIGVFAAANPLHFHAVSGEGYSFVAQHITRLDETNPQVAARLVAPFLQWDLFVEPNRGLMKDALTGIASMAHLSPDVYELVSKALESS